MCKAPSVCRGIHDLFDMMQSRTFVLQLGYGLLKIVLLNLLPELRPLFRSIERGPVEASPAPKPGGKLLAGPD